VRHPGRPIRLLRAAALGSLLAVALPAWARAAQDPGARRTLTEALPVGRKEVALTFDDGPSASTAAILDLLRSHGQKATFFTLGTELERFPGIAQRAAREGHELGAHGMTHRSFPALGRHRLTREIGGTADLIQELTGRRPAFVRPPYGNMNRQVVAVAASLHMTVVLWSVDTLDWQNPGPGTIARRVLQNLRPGEIVLMHDGGAPRQQTVQAMAAILRAMDARGYRSVTLSQLVADAQAEAPPAPRPASPPAAVRPGTVYGGPCGA